MLPLDRLPTGAVGLVLTLMTHVAGWPLPRGGAQQLTDAMAAYLRELGGEIVSGTPIASIDELPKARAVLCDLSPRPLLRIAGHRFPDWYRRALERYRYGMGVYKVDWALDAPVPWRDPACAQAVLEKGYPPQSLDSCKGGVNGACAQKVLEKGYPPQSIASCIGVDARCATAVLDQGYPPQSLSSCKR